MKECSYILIKSFCLSLFSPVCNSFCCVKGIFVLRKVLDSDHTLVYKFQIRSDKMLQ